MKKILVTGAGGYIGSIASYLLLKNGYDIVTFDNYTTGYKQPLSLLKEKFPDKIVSYEGDLRKNIETVFEKEKDLEMVLHYAASCLVNESMERPEKYFTNNVCGTQSLLSAMLKNKVKKIVFSSTCAVYGEAEYVPIDEKHPRHPANPYGESKKMIEDILTWYDKLHDLKYVILRYFNVCGASDDGLIGDSKKPSSLLVQNAVRGAMGIEDFFLTCPKVDTKDGTPIRDYINVVDLNNAHIKAINYLSGGSDSQIINLGTGSGNSVLEVVKEVEKKTGHKFDLQKGETRKGEYAKMIADIKKAKKVLSWEPKRNISDSVESLIKWYKKHPEGWEN